MKNYDVYGIGNALCDIEYQVTDQILSSAGVDKGLMTLIDDQRLEELYRVLENQKHHNIICGGSAANSIIAVSQLGGNAYYSCKVNKDEQGEFYLDNLQENRIDTYYSKQTLPATDQKTGRCLVLITPDAERSMNTYLGITSTLSEAELDEEAIKQSKYVYIEGYLVASPTGHAAALKAIEIAKKYDTKVALTFSDPNMTNFFKKEMNMLVDAGIDLLFCNFQEAQDFTGAEDLNSIREELKSKTKQFAITLGRNGSMVYDGEIFIDIEPHQVEAIDSNGAGDIFAGCFLYGLTNGHTPAGSAQLASYASSKLVTQFGPRLSQPQMADVKNKIFTN
ncbi:adenosine kinase [Bacteriovoracaceae bacterium]|nr:adenosine kinase [Bacteriovoracaceae bacterium]